MSDQGVRAPYEAGPAAERPIYRNGVAQNDTDVMRASNRIQATPVLAGVVTAIGVLLILTVLAVAVGASAFEPRDVGESVSTGAVIWGIVSVIIAFFAGGWVAAKSSAVAGMPSAVLSGVIVGAVLLTILVWIAGSTASGLLGAIGTNLGDIVNSVENQGPDAQTVFNNVEDDSWWTLLGLVLAWIAAAVGGAAGTNSRDEVMQTKP